MPDPLKPDRPSTVSPPEAKFIDQIASALEGAARVLRKSGSDGFYESMKQENVFLALCYDWRNERASVLVTTPNPVSERAISMAAQQLGAEGISSLRAERARRQ